MLVVDGSSVKIKAEKTKQNMNKIKLLEPFFKDGRVFFYRLNAKCTPFSLSDVFPGMKKKKKNAQYGFAIVFVCDRYY